MASFSWRFVGLATTLAIFLSNLASLASADCYNPNSLPRGPPDYQPSEAVSDVDGFQMCCATFRDPPDIPRSDGLCTGPTGQIWRESCTDRSWRSPNCIKLCVNGTDSDGEPMSSTDELITVCPNRSYCCGENNTACCDQGKGVWLRDGMTTTVNPNATQTSKTSTSSTASAVTIPAITTTSASPVIASPSPRPNSTGLSGGAIAGIVVGALAALGILGVTFILLRRQKKRRAAATEEIAYTSLQPDSRPRMMAEKDGRRRSEILCHDGASEMENTNNGLSELAGSSGHRELE